MQLNVTLWIFLQLASVMSSGMAFTGGAEYEVFIDLNKDGSVANSSNLPACDNGGMISILSYRYLRRKCVTTCFSLLEGKLSADAEVRLHEMCSFKENCSTMNFPVNDLRNQNFNTVSVRYTCAESGRTIFNMCDNRSALLKQPIELVAENTTGLKACLCFLFNGKFKIGINDLRLQARETGNCSSGTLTINTNHFSCNETKPNRGSIFKSRTTDIVQNAVVSLEYITATFTPQMVAVSLEPVEETTLRCSAKTVIEATTTPVLKSESSTLHHRHNSIRYIATETLSEKKKWVVPLVVIHFVVLLIAVVLVWKRLPLLKRLRRKYTHNKPDKDAENLNKSHLNHSFGEEIEKQSGETALGKKEENTYTCIEETFTSEVSTAGGNDNTYDKTSMGNRVQRKELNYNRIPNSERSDFVTEPVVPKPGLNIYSFAKPPV